MRRKCRMRVGMIESAVGREAAGKGGCFLIYAVSDLHGCLGKYRKLLDALPLGDADTLYVLGDVIDRGAGLTFCLT